MEANHHPQTVPVGLLLSLLAGTFISVAGLALTHWLVSPAWLQANNEVAANYLQTLGTIFAVLLAFVVFVVWQQHNDTRAALQSEATELADLNRVLKSFPETTHAAPRACLVAYQRAVVEEEWTTHACGHASPAAAKAIEDLWRVLQVIEPQTRREEVLYSEALDRFNDLCDARSHRLHCSRLRLPGGMWSLLLTNGALLLGSMWLFGVGSFCAHALMTASLAISISFILYLIADLDNPFWGAWRISSNPIGRALD